MPYIKEELLNGILGNMIGETILFLVIFLENTARALGNQFMKNFNLSSFAFR